MCGIAGIVKFKNHKVSIKELSLMTDCMVHRGPDDDGFYVEGSVGIGMRRLSIIDVKGGHQPLSNEEGNLHLILNGEIYNYVELRDRLIKNGHLFSSGSDAEVILHLYEEKGVQALEDLNGMFAFALFDSKQQTLWIARDRLGIKPFFYVHTKDYFVFASDIKAIRKFHASYVQADQVIKYISLGYAPGTETIWHGISKLLPGHHAVLQFNGSIRIQSYWDIHNFNTWNGSVEMAAEQLVDLFNDSVRLQLRTDVPLGVFLSGGVDSSVLVASASRKLTEPLKTFTIDFEGKDSRDAFYSAQVAKLYGTDHLNLKMTSQDAVTALDELLNIIDEPLGDSALLPVYVLSKYAREYGVRVLLNGAGGDEIFGGYARHWRPRLGTPAWVAENTNGPARKVLSFLWAKFQPQRGLRAADPRLAWGVSISGVDLSAVRYIFKDKNIYKSVNDVLFEEHNALLTASPGDINSYSYKRMVMDVKNYLPENILSLTDKATMAASVEGRVPFLDHRLVEFAFSLPPELNMLYNNRKGLLKRVAATWLPSELFVRKKEGFNPPDKGWFGKTLKDKVTEELLGVPTPVLKDILSYKEVEKLLQNPQRREQAATTLYSLFLFNKWHRKQLI